MADANMDMAGSGYNSGTNYNPSGSSQTHSDGSYPGKPIIHHTSPVSWIVSILAIVLFVGLKIYIWGRRLGFIEYESDQGRRPFWWFFWW